MDLKTDVEVKIVIIYLHNYVIIWFGLWISEMNNNILIRDREEYLWCYKAFLLNVNQHNCYL